MKTSSLWKGTSFGRQSIFILIFILLLTEKTFFYIYI
jgi:hypothetical protein